MNNLPEILTALSLFYLLALSNSETCTTPLGETGECLPYTQCANLHEFSSKYNLKTEKDVNILLCNNTNTHEEGPQICCTSWINNYYSGINFEDNLNKTGVDVLQSLQCGKQLGYRVSGGEQVPMGQFPFMALLRYDAPDPFLCGGSLITHRFVLTAAHCITQDLNGVRLGEHNIATEVDCTLYGSRRRVCMPPVEDYGISEVISHPEYDRYRMSHDIALLKLDQEVKFKVHISPICLPTQSMTIQLTEPRYTIAGWGRTEDGTRSEILQMAQVPHRDREVCKKIFKPVPITYNQICAGGEQNIDSCKGDSGGPLFVTAPLQINAQTRSRYVQYGLVSFGIRGCGGNGTKAAAYSNVVEHMKWITNIIS